MNFISKAADGNICGFFLGSRDEFVCMSVSPSGNIEICMKESNLRLYKMARHTGLDMVGKA